MCGKLSVAAYSAAVMTMMSLWYQAQAASLLNLFSSLPPTVPLASLPRVPPASVSPGAQCRAAIRGVEQVFAVPTGLMAAIGRVESGRAGPDGRIDPWPWSINANGVDQVFDSKSAAIAAVRALQAAGTASIDVGCMQVNLKYHPDAFASLDDAFDPIRNATYAAGFLQRLHTQTGAWPTATAWYHSATPELGEPYARKVLAALPAEQAQSGVATVFAPQLGGGGSGGGQGLDNRVALARVLPMAAGTIGRSLAAYRAAPVMAIAAAPQPPILALRR